MDWDVAQISGTTIARPPADRTSTASGYVVLPSDVRARFVDPTLMATRTFCNIHLVDSIPDGNDNESTFFAMGLIMWTDVNDTPPSGADCPDPLRDGDLDWVNRWVFLAPRGTDVNVGASPLPLNSNIFDLTHLSKAKRRFGQDMGLLLAVSGQTAGAGITPSARFMADVRALIKE